MDIPATALTYVLIAAVACLPPALAMRLFLRSFRRARRHGLSGNRFRLAALACLVALLYNAGAVIGTLRVLSSDGAFEFTLWQGIALTLAWVCFWVWLFLAIALGRDLGRTHGLR